MTTVGACTGGATSRKRVGTSNAASRSSDIVRLPLQLHTGSDSVESFLASIVAQKMFRYASQSRPGEVAQFRCCEERRWSTAIRLRVREALRACSPSLIAAIGGHPSMSVLRLSQCIWKLPVSGCHGRCLARTTPGCPRDQRRPEALGNALQGFPDTIRLSLCLRGTHRRHSERPRRDCFAALPTTPERFQLSNCIP